MLEISVHRDYIKTFDWKHTYNSLEQTENILGKFKESRMYCFIKDNPEYCVECIALTAIVVSTVTQISLTRGATVATLASPEHVINGMADFEEFFNIIIQMAKKVLVGTGIVTTIKDCIKALARGITSGSNMSWDEIFQALFKNLALLAIGLSFDKIAWKLYSMFA